MSWLWPGLPRLWAHGDWVAFFWAAIFAVLLNSALVVTFIWPELVSPMIRVALWSALAAVWLTSAAWYAWRIRFETVSPQQLADLGTLFVQAQDQYLRADWYQAEVTLRRLLRADSQDVDSRLMLATLMRRTGRIDEARRELARLEQLERSEKWQLEIEQERKRMARLPADGLGDASSDGGEEAIDSTSDVSERLTETSEAA
jgi:signal transduction histidine kinase